MVNKRLTETQLGVIELLKQGKTQTEIADELGKSNATICMQVKRIKKKGYN